MDAARAHSALQTSILAHYLPSIWEANDPKIKGNKQEMAHVNVGKKIQ